MAGVCTHSESVGGLVGAWLLPGNIISASAAATIMSVIPAKALQRFIYHSVARVLIQKKKPRGLRDLTMRGHSRCHRHRWRPCGDNSPAVFVRQEVKDRIVWPIDQRNVDGNLGVFAIGEISSLQIPLN